MSELESNGFKNFDRGLYYKIIVSVKDLVSRY